MAKFSIIEIVDWQEGFRLSLFIMIQSCIANNEGNNLFSKSCRLSATKDAKTVIAGLQKCFSDPKICGDEILVVVRTPSDMSLEEFQYELLPFVQKGVKVLVVNEGGYSLEALNKHPQSIRWLKISNKVTSAVLTTGAYKQNENMSRTLKKF